MAAESSLTLDDQIALYDFLTERFTLDEMKDLAFRLGINPEQFESDTRQKFSRGLISYCQRSNTPPLGCLIVKVAQQRPEPSIAAMIEKVPSCTPNKVVQIVLTKDALSYSVNLAALKEDLAKLAQKYPNEVAVLGVLAGSVRILISMPEDGANRLLGIQPATVMNGEYRVLSLAAFDALPPSIRGEWENAARNGQASSLSKGNQKLDIAKGASEPIQTVTVSTLATVAAVSAGISIPLLILAGIILAGVVVVGGTALATPRARVTNRCGVNLAAPPQFAQFVPSLENGQSMDVVVPPGTYRLDRDALGNVRLLAPIVGTVNIGRVDVAGTTLDGQLIREGVSYTVPLGGRAALVLCGARR